MGPSYQVVGMSWGGGGGRGGNTYWKSDRFVNTKSPVSGTGRGTPAPDTPIPPRMIAKSGKFLNAKKKKFGFSVPTSAPLNVKAVNESSTSIVVSWEPVPERHRHGVIRNYAVDVAECDDGAGIPTKTFNTTDFQITIDGLKKFTCYQVKVKAGTIKGHSKFSPPYDCKTGQDGKSEKQIAFFSYYRKHFRTAVFVGRSLTKAFDSFAIRQANSGQIHSDEGLTLETSVFESFTVANLPYRPCG